MTKKPPSSKSIHPPQGTKPLTFRLDDDLRTIIEKAAAREQRSLSFTIVDILKAWADAGHS
jgi:uncharacterized protein (DUF1778 family)